MYLLTLMKFTIILILLFCRLSNVSCGDTTQESDSSSHSLNDDPNDASSEISDDVSPETNEKPIAEDNKEDETGRQKLNNLGGCSKRCQNSYGKKYEQHCVLTKYKSVESLRTKAECFSKCKTDAWCVSAIYTKPRSVTTLDLKTLFNKVIDSETQVAIEEPGSLVDHASEYGTDIRENDNERPNGAISNEDLQNHAIIDTSSSVANYSGSCYLYDTSISTQQKLECNPSNLTFEYGQIDCFEDPNCAKSNRQCACGRCGKDCHEFNYVRVENACMAKYFFGHLTATSLEDCLEFCLQTPGCKSIDFGSSQSCLINYVDRNQTKLMIGCDRKNNEVWDYYELLCDSECADEKPRPDKSEDTCVNIPGICQNGGNCETIELPAPHQSFTYSCHCPCNWCGKHCEKLNMKTYKNGCLNSSVLAWSVAENSDDCIDMCLNEIDCHSVSYSATAGTCVLHSAHHNSQHVISSPHCPTYRADFSEKEWSLYQIICNSSVCHSEVEVIDAKEMKGCSGNPCSNDGQCADIFKNGKIIGYHCLCKCGYCGDRCQTENYMVTEDACIWGSHISDSPNDYYRRAVSLNICISTCASKYPLCRSVDYSNKGECMLNKKDSDLTTITPKCNNYLRQQWNLYDISCVCNNKPVLY